MSRDWTPEEYYYVQKATGHSGIDMMEGLRWVYKDTIKKMYDPSAIAKHRQFELFGNLINNFESLYDRAMEIPDGFEKLKELERQLQQFIDTGDGDEEPYLVKWFQGRLDGNFYYGDENERLFIEACIEDINVEQDNSPTLTI